MLHTMKNMLGVKRSVKANRKVQLFLPRLEALEDRVTPTTVTYHGGTIMNNVQVENVFYGSSWNTPANQQLQTQINQFTAYLVQSPYMDMLNQYHGNGLEFGNNYVGRGNLVGSKVYEGSVSGTAKTSDIVSNLISGVLGPPPYKGGGLPALPSLNNLYIVYLPPGPPGGSNVSNDVCVIQDFYAYHSSMYLPGPPWNINIPTDAPVPNQIQYIIVPYPGQGNPQPHEIPDPFNALTVTVSHELAEAVTDPNLIWAYDPSQFTYGDVGSGWWEFTGTKPDPTTGKTIVLGQEICDLVEPYTGLLNGYQVEAVWSNATSGPELPPGAIWKTEGSVTSNSAIGADTPSQMIGPISKPDSYQVAANGSLLVNAAQGVLANDSDVFHNPLEAVLVSGPSHGQLQYLLQNGSFSYVPKPGYAGIDTFTYTPSDGTVLGDPVTVTINVTDPTTTVLHVSSTYISAGQSITLSATLTGTVANSNTPQGTVTFFNGSTSVGTVTLANGSASLSLTLSAGSDSFTAKYNGLTTEGLFGGFVFDASTSTTVPVTVSVPIPPPPPPPPPHPPIVSPLLALFNQFLGDLETVNANDTTITDNLFGFPMVETYDYFGNLVSVTLLGFDVTFLFG